MNAKLSDRQLIGKTDTEIAAENEGAVSVWRGTVGQECDTGENVEARALSDLGSHKYVCLTWGELRDDRGQLVYNGWLASPWEV